MAIQSSSLVVGGGDMNIVDFLTGTIPDGQFTVTVNLSETIDTAKTFPIILGGQTSRSDFNGSFVKVTLTGTQATIRAGSQTGITDYQVMIVSSDNMVSLQLIDFSIPQAQQSENAVIPTAVDSINNRVIPFPSVQNSIQRGDIGNGLFPIIDFTDSTSVTQMTATRSQEASATNVAGANISVYLAEFER